MTSPRKELACYIVNSLRIRHNLPLLFELLFVVGVFTSAVVVVDDNDVIIVVANVAGSTLF